MGLAIDREQFDPVDYRRFGQRLDECLLAMGRLLERPGFGTGPTTLGAELELFLVDSQGRALPLNQVVRSEAADPRVVLEIDRFNLELNLTPAPLQGRPFAAFASELDQALSIVRRAAAWHGGRIVMVGILPTLRVEDLELAAISDAVRYRALNNGIRRLRQEPFQVRIDGADPLELAADDVGLEGANTSFQIHLRVDPDRFADHFNAAQLATGPVLAVAGNSPTFLGHRLWQETIVADPAVPLRPTARRVLQVLRNGGPQRVDQLAARLSASGRRPIRPATVANASGELRAAGLAAVDVDDPDVTVGRWSAVPTTRDPLLETVDLHGAHDFRHTYATWLEDAGIPARVIDELMGHEATGRSGQQRGSAMGAHYRHTTPEMAARAVDAIQQRLTVVLAVAELAVERHPNRSTLRVF
jgi:predicted ArsR family transcriptional regulator